MQDSLHTLAVSSVGFESARLLSAPDATRHGHSFYATVTANAALPTLQTALQAACAPWQWRDLNDFFASPDDLTLAQHLKATLEPQLGELACVDLRSAPDRGLRLADGFATYWLDDAFSAAHFLPHVPEGHQCGRLHGHGFKVKLWADAQRCSIVDMQAAWQPLRDRLHHAYLNHIDGLSNPTSEHLAAWLWQRLQGELPITAVEVFETATAGSRCDVSGFTIWKEQRFESAQPFDAAGRYTGHSYLARVFLHGADLPETGWLRDFADVKAAFKPIYKQLDHYALDTVTDLTAYDAQTLSAWMWRKLQPYVPELSRVEVFEDAHNGAVCVGEAHVHG